MKVALLNFIYQAIRLVNFVKHLKVKPKPPMKKKKGSVASVATYLI